MKLYNKLTTLFVSVCCMNLVFADAPAWESNAGAYEYTASLTAVIEGHTDGLKFAHKEKTNWELSMERASAARLQLVNNGVDQERISRIVSYGFSQPVNKDDYFDPRNRRINIIILNTDEQMSVEEKANIEGVDKASSH